VKHPLGGYGEACVRVGEDTPSALPHLEIDVSAHGQMRRRGANPMDVDRLVEVLLTITKNRPNAEQLVSALFARTENIPEISDDPDFWPRVVLDVSGKPFIRARDQREALAFAKYLIAFLEAGAFRDYCRWRNAEITGGTPHVVQLRCRESSLHQLASKVAFGLAWLGSPEARSRWDILGPLRELVLRFAQNGQQGTAQWISKPNTITSFPDHQVAAVIRWGSHLRGLVSFYGDCSVVEWAPPSDSLACWQTVAAISRRDGTKTELVSGELSAKIIAALTPEAKVGLPFN
jgi:hypothetical protein